MKYLLLQEAVVEHAKAGAEHGLGCFSVADAPRQTYAGREIGMIADVILRLKAKAEAKRNVGTDAPLVFSIHSYIDQVDAREWVACRDLKLTGPAACRANLGGRPTRCQTLLRNLVGVKRGKGKRTVEVLVAGV